MRRAGARRPGAGGMCHSRGDPPRLPVRAPAHRRPRIAGGHAGRVDARRRGVDATASDMVKAPRSEGRALHVRVKRAKGRSLSSKRWLERQLNDPYVARARREGYRSRAAFKLAEIDD